MTFRELRGLVDYYSVFDIPMSYFFLLRSSRLNVRLVVMQIIAWPLLRAHL